MYVFVASRSSLVIYCYYCGGRALDADILPFDPVIVDVLLMATEKAAKSFPIRSLNRLKLRFPTV